MRLPGISEIILIVIVAAIVILGVRIFGTPPQRKTNHSTEYEGAEKDEVFEDRRILKARRSRRTQILGIIIIIIGAIVMLSTLAMVKWVFWGPLGAIALILIGFITILAARRK